MYCTRIYSVLYVVGQRSLSVSYIKDDDDDDDDIMLFFSSAMFDCYSRWKTLQYNCTRENVIWNAFNLPP